MGINLGISRVYWKQTVFSELQRWLHSAVFSEVMIFSFQKYYLKAFYSRFYSRTRMSFSNSTHAMTFISNYPIQIFRIISWYTEFSHDLVKIIKNYIYFLLQFGLQKPKRRKIWKAYPSICIMHISNIFRACCKIYCAFYLWNNRKFCEVLK